MNHINDEWENLRQLNRRYLETLKIGQTRMEQLLLLNKFRQTSRSNNSSSIGSSKEARIILDNEKSSLNENDKRHINSISTTTSMPTKSILKLKSSSETVLSKNGTLDDKTEKEDQSKSVKRSLQFSTTNNDDEKLERNKKLIEADGNVRNKPEKNQPLSSTNNKPVNTRLWTRGQKNNPLLGHDWIAANLDNENTENLDNKNEEYFEEIRQFRNLHRKECVTTSNPSKILGLDVNRPISPEISDPAHKCLHGYTINTRLFTEPVYSDEEGRSVCPICYNTRKPPTIDDPGFVRVSIPRSTIDQTHRFRPWPKGSFDGTDSCSLSANCQAGWETCQPHLKKPMSSLDLKGSTKNVTDKVVQDTVNQYSKRSKLTNQLLDQSHALRLQQHNRHVNFKDHTSFGGVSTNYPV